MTFDVRRARVEDKAAIETFIERAYGRLAGFKGPDRWRWQFVDNPFLPPGGLLPVWIALDGDEIVGQICVQASQVQINGVVSAAGWVVDVVILPGYRGRKLGHRLYEAVARDVGVLLTLTMAPATRRMAERSGAITLGPAWQFSRWVRVYPNDVQRFVTQRLEHHPNLRKCARLACERLWIHHLAASLMRSFTLLRDVLARKYPRRRDIVEVTRFEQNIDELWQRAAPGYPALCPRTSEFLNWRFVTCPQLCYRLFVAFRNGVTVGYSVLRRTTQHELRQGIIVDLFADREDRKAFGDLIRHAIDLFAGEVASIECGTSIPEIGADLQQNGFFRSRTLLPTVVVSDVRVRKELARLKHDWFFSKGDHDWDQVHLG